MLLRQANSYRLCSLAREERSLSNEPIVRRVYRSVVHLCREDQVGRLYRFSNVYRDVRTDAWWKDLRFYYRSSLSHLGPADAAAVIDAGRDGICSRLDAIKIPTHFSAGSDDT